MDPLVLTIAGLLLTAVGMAIGAFANYFFTTRYTHRPVLRISLNEVLRVDLTHLGSFTELRIRDRSFLHFVVLNLSIENAGHADIVVADASPPRPKGATPLPRIDFPDIQILAIATQNQSPSFWIPLACVAGYKRLFINLHRIAAGTRAVFTLTGVFEPNHPSVRDPIRLHFFPGAITNVDVRPEGLLRPPYLLR